MKQRTPAQARSRATRGLAIIGSVTAAVALSSAAAVAFPSLVFWHDAANFRNAGSQGIYYTGGAQDFNLTCSNCHIKGTNPQGLIGLNMTPTPAFQVVNNQKAYKPGQLYAFSVDMTGEHLGTPADNGNGFTATVEDASGNRTGTLFSDTPNNVQSPCAAASPFPEPVAPATTYLYGDCHGILFIQRTASTHWTYKWQAPGAGTGQVTIFWGAVDGDHREGDSLNDDSLNGTIKLMEGN